LKDGRDGRNEGGERGISEKKLDFELSCRVYQAKIALVNIKCQARGGGGMIVGAVGNVRVVDSV